MYLHDLSGWQLTKTCRF